MLILVFVPLVNDKHWHPEVLAAYMTLKVLRTL